MVLGPPISSRPITWESSPSADQPPDSPASRLFKTTFSIAGLTLAVVLAGKGAGGSTLAQFEKLLPKLINGIVAGGKAVKIQIGLLLFYVRKDPAFQDHAREVVFGRWRGAPANSELRVVLDDLLKLVKNPPPEKRLRVVKKAVVRQRHRPIDGPLAEVARLLIAKRESLRLSQRVVATGAGVDRSYYCRLEGGKACLPHSLLRVLRFFNERAPYTDAELIAIYRAWRPTEIKTEWFDLERGIFWVKLPPGMTLEQAIALSLSQFAQQLLRDKGLLQAAIAEAIGRTSGSSTDLFSGLTHHLKLEQLEALARLGRVDGSLAYLAGRPYLADFWTIGIRRTNRSFRRPVAARF